MATTTNIIKTGAKLFKATYTGTAPFRVFDCNTSTYLATQTNDTEIYVSGDYSDEPHIIEVFDSTETQTPEYVKYPRHIIIQWRGDWRASHYIIQEYYSAAWNDLITIYEQGSGYYQYRYVPTSDSGVTKIRVSAVPVSGATNSGYQHWITIGGYPISPITTHTFTVDNSDLTIAAV